MFVTQRKKEFYDQLIGKRQGKIVVNGVLRTEPRKGKIWSCICDCGTEFEACTSSITSAKIQACPKCALKESTERSKKQLTKHGLHSTRLHKLWWSMISRCTYSTDTNWEFYGARGITVCEEWRNSFLLFYDWAISNGYDDKLSIDRRDSDGNYEPSNCRWISMQAQFSNRRTTRYIEVDGKRKTLSEWSKIIGMSRTAINAAEKRGMDVKQYIKGKLDSHEEAIEKGVYNAEVFLEV